MSDENTEVQVEIEPNGTALDPVEDLKQQHERLKAEAERERAGRLAAEQRAAAVEHQSHTETANTSIQALEAQSEAHRQAFEAAMERGDWSAVSREQVALADSRAALAQWQQHRQAMEMQARQPAPPADPVEAMCQGRGQAAQDWIRSHADYVTDPTKLKKLNAAHHHALVENAEGSSGYFSEINKYLGLNDQARSSNGQYTSRRSPAPVAPVGNSGGGMTTTRIRLSPGEVAAATDGTISWSRADLQAGRIKDPKLIGQPVGVPEYARRLAIMRKDPRWES